MLKKKAISCKPEARCAALLLVLALAIFVAGCGSSGSSDPTTSNSTPPANGSKSFAKYTKGKESKEIVGFGKEATVTEREAASTVLTQNLKARQAADFSGQCNSLGKAGLESVLGPVKEVKAAMAKCPSELEKLAEPLSSSKGPRTNTLSGPIAALRVKGSKGYALYHGNDGNAYAMPMEKEEGDWLVGSIVTIELE